jgi:hypothetical protein
LPDFSACSIPNSAWSPSLFSLYFQCSSNDSMIHCKQWFGRMSLKNPKSQRN